MISKLDHILSELLNGKIIAMNINNKIFVNQIAKDLLSSSAHTDEDIICMDRIIRISNIVYNNTDRELLFLDHGIYDLILELYKTYNPNYQVGSDIVYFEPVGDIKIDNEEQMMRPITVMDKDFIENSLFLEDLEKRPEFDLKMFYKRPVYEDIHISKRVTNTAHKYPKLVGTLDKSKFVLNQQARDIGVFDDSNVKIFERDFIGKHLKDGILDPNRKFYMVAELKYDGISVEGEVSDYIDSARSRGDTGNDVATDLTPILKGYKFRNAEGHVDHNELFGMKFEAIITNNHLYEMSLERDKAYVNCRNAIIGLFGSSDANKFRDYITLVPLATSLEIDRLTEIEFLNKYYNSGVYLIHSVLYGNYMEILFQVKKFLEEAEYMRDFIPYMYDGIVLSYIEPDLIDILGRENSVNKYSMAIKFNALKKYTTFTGYDYTVGKNGVVTPMIHFLPIEFYGMVNDHSTGHSYKRFMELGLRLGDIICVAFVNDVMCYVTKPFIEANENNTNPIEVFPEICPFCLTKLEISKSEKSVICPNKNCPERNMNRLSDTVSMLGIKDFSLETLKLIAKNIPEFELTLVSLIDLINKDLSFLGEKSSYTFKEYIQNLLNNRIYDYQAFGALGFSNLSNEKWKLILRKISIIDIVHAPDDELLQELVNIKGIGPVTARTVVEERYEFINDINIIFNNFKGLVITFGVVPSGKTIRITGFRDRLLIEDLNNKGHNASDGAITKDTDYLIVPIAGHVSSKTKKAIEYGVDIIPLQDFIYDINAYLEN